MLRLVATMTLGIALGYCLFFMRLEGRSLASHLGDVWRSPVMQAKVKLVEREVPRALKGKLPSIPQQAPSPAQQRQAAETRFGAPAAEHPTSEERHTLNQLIRRIQKSLSATPPKK